LYSGLKAGEDLRREFRRIFAYPDFLSSIDQRNQEYTAMMNEMQADITMFNKLTAFIEPEILTANPDLIRKYINKDKRLEDYDFYLLDLFRRNEHVLTEKEEKLLGLLEIKSENGYDIFRNLWYSDIEFPEVTMSSGEKEVMDRSTMIRYLQSRNREDRKLAMESYYRVKNQYSNTLGQLVVHKLNGEKNISQARNYESILHMSMDANNIPVEIYHSLLENTRKSLDAHYRYWELKKRMLGVDTLYMYDLIAPVVEDVDLEFSYEEAIELVMEALSPMSEEYRQTVQKAFDGRWIDVYPSTGKPIGAWSSDIVAHDLHPFIMMNYLGYYNDVSILIHELGHTMHSYYACKNQSFTESDYSFFIAEVPSTINSILLVHSMLDKELDDDTRLALLMNYLDEFVAAIFRQVMYAEFELKIREKIELDEALTADVISAVFGDVSRTFYGHNKGIINVEEQYFSKWNDIPHFFGYTYYVYVYTTSFLTSVTLADRILSGEEGAIDRFMELISAGGSDYPMNLLKEAGVDLTTPAPLDYAMKNMNRLMDEVEEILDSRE
jgi:oligoendopeptidase F